jgi:outer membrane receptor protein involved in Fe transport
MKSSPVFQIRSRPSAVLLSVALATCATLPLSGQTAATSVPAKTAPSADAPVVLSPFTVATEKDEGFVASSSLAGGRLAGDLRDTPVAYSVLTKDFLDTLQITDFNQSMEWMPNTYLNGDNNTRLSWTNDQNIVVIRGFSLNQPQRDYFPFTANFDSFNLERMDLARGANAILFGNGGYGGSPNSVSKRARTDRAFGELRTTAASWDTYRMTADWNLPLSATTAVRTNLLWVDNQGWRDHDFQKKQGVALAATWKPTPRTEVRANGEYGEMRGNIVVTALTDRLSGWDGVTTYAARLTTLPGNANALGVTRYGNNVALFTVSNGTDTLINYAQMAQTLGGNANTAVPVGGALVTGLSANIAGQPMGYSHGLPANRFDRAITGSNFRLPDRSFSTSPDAVLREERHKILTLGVTHQFGRNLFADVSGNYVMTDKFGNVIANRGLAEAFVDINQTLPTGAPNPHFRDPYSEASSYRFPVKIEARELRASLAYVLSQTRWGDFKFNLLGGDSRRDTWNSTYNYALATNADARFWPTDQQVRFRYYWNDATRPLPQPSTWNYVDPVAGVTRQVNAGYYLNDGNVSYQNLQYGVGSASAKLWGGRLSLLGAMRRDYFEAGRDVTLALRSNPADWNGLAQIFKPAAPADYYSLMYVPKSATGVPTGPATNAGARPRDGSGFPQPQYAGDRFQDDYSAPKVQGYVTTYTGGGVLHLTPWVSVFTNYGETYNLPAITGVRIDRGLFPATLSKGWDYGLRFSALQGRFVANVIRYTGEQVGLGNNGLDPSINAIINARIVGERASGARNIRGVEPLPSNFYDSTKFEGDGYELDVTANLTRSWRLMVNGGLPKLFRRNIIPETRAWIAANDKVLRQILGDAGILLDAANRASVDQSIPVNLQSLDANNAVNGWNNIQTQLASLSAPKLPAQNTATANLFTDYAIREGRLKGVRLGGGMNFRGRRVLGNRAVDTIRDPANPLAAIDDPAVDATNTVYMDSYYTATATLGYTFKPSRKATLALDLRIDNLFNCDRPLYYNTTQRPVGGDLSNPARTTVPNNFGYLAPRSYSVTATLRF